MATPLKPLTHWGGVGGPNPSKVAIILTELSLPYESHYIPLHNIKNPTYLHLNPNGRLPTLIDPNNSSFKLWESGAIIEYLVSKYDTDHAISYEAGSERDWECKQWLYFQTSGQGPYYGQAFWFKMTHPENIPSAIDRYINEVKRVSGVLDGHLKDREWLVGDKCTYADLAFVTWQVGIKRVVGEFDWEGEFPYMNAWLERLVKREAVAKILKEKEKLEAEMMAKADREGRNPFAVRKDE